MTNDRALRIAVGALIGAWLLGPPAVGGGENLSPPDASAPPVRILLIMPAESGKLGKQVARLDRALAESRGFLSRAGSLDEADAVVHFTGFRQTLDEKGVRSDWWDGQYRLLTTPARDVRLRGEVPSRFSLLVIEQESWEMKPVVGLLARTLARALGRQARPEEADSDDNSAAFDDSSLAFDDSSWNHTTEAGIASD